MMPRRARRVLLGDSRREARVRDGELVLLSDRDRSLWDRDQIERGRTAPDRVLAMRSHGRCVVEGAIASLHLERERDSPQIGALYGQLALLERLPVVVLKRAVASARPDGPAAASAPSCGVRTSARRCL
jgi:RNA polymerase sigma-70 factor (ECF subfamily)